MAGVVRAQDINATVAPNSGSSANFVDIQNTSGDIWYFWGAPTPAAASMSRMDGIEVGEYPWPSPGSFAPDPTDIVQNRIFANEFLRVYPKTVAVGNVIQIEFSYSPLGTHYHFNVAVTAGAQVTSLNIIDPSPSAASIVHWRVSFDRAISGVTAANFAFANVAGLTNVSITGISADAAQPSTNWTITVNSGTGNGLLGLKWARHASESPSVPNSFVGQMYDFSSYPIVTLDPVGRVIDRNTTWTMTSAAVVRGAPVNYQWLQREQQKPKRRDGDFGRDKLQLHAAGRRPGHQSVFLPCIYHTRLLWELTDGDHHRGGPSENRHATGQYPRRHQPAGHPRGRCDWHAPAVPMVSRQPAGHVRACG
jgi:hypothetical protein